MDRPADSRHATEQGLEQWLDEGPDQAPERLLAAVTTAIEAGTVKRRTLVNRIIETLTLAGAAAAVVAVAIIAIAALPGSVAPGVTPGTGDPGDPGCPRLVEVVNRVLPPAADPDADETEILMPPYVAVMGARLDGGNQIATIELRIDRPWSDETLETRIDGPVSRSSADPIMEPVDELRVTLGTPGTYRLTYVGQESGCRLEVDVRAELDTTLRTYDAQRGLTEPPPADMR